MRLKKSFVPFLLFVIIGLLVMLPSVLQYSVKIGFTSKAEEEPESFTGRLTVWHIGNEVNTQKILRSAADSFEKANAYVFIDIIQLSAQEAEELISENKLPDIFSYCGEFGELPEYNPKPYALSPYILFVNDSLEIGKIGVQDLSTVEKSQVEIPILLDALGFDDAEQVKYLAAPDCQKRFLDEEIKALVAPLSFDYQLEKLGSINYSAYAVFNYTDKIRFIDTVNSQDKLKVEMCEKFADTLLSDKVQKSVISFGHLTVKKNTATTDYSLLYDNSVSQEAYILLCEKGIFPNDVKIYN